MFRYKMADFSKRSLNNYSNETFNYNSKFYFIAQWSVVWLRPLSLSCSLSLSLFQSLLGLFWIRFKWMTHSSMYSLPVWGFIEPETFKDYFCVSKIYWKQFFFATTEYWFRNSMSCSFYLFSKWSFVHKQRITVACGGVSVVSESAINFKGPTSNPAII